MGLLFFVFLSDPQKGNASHFFQSSSAIEAFRGKTKIRGIFLLASAWAHGGVIWGIFAHGKGDSRITRRAPSGSVDLVEGPHETLNEPCNEMWRLLPLFCHNFGVSCLAEVLFDVILGTFRRLKWP